MERGERTARATPSSASWAPSASPRRTAFSPSTPRPRARAKGSTRPRNAGWPAAARRDPGGPAAPARRLPRALQRAPPQPGSALRCSLAGSPGRPKAGPGGTPHDYYRAAVRSCAARPGSAESTLSCASTVSATPPPRPRPGRCSDAAAARIQHTRSRDHARIVITVAAVGHRTAHTVSRGEASVEEHPWARQGSRDDTGRCCAISGAGRVRCVAARGVPARSGLPRHGLPSGRLPCPASRARRARADGRAREQRGGCAGGRRSCLGA